MNTYGLYYFLEGIAFAFFFIMAVLNISQKGNRLRIILGVIMAYWALQHLFSYFYTVDYLSGSRSVCRMLNVIDMTAEPTCAFLLLELCRPGWLTWRKVLWNEIPFVAMGVISIVSGNMMVYYAMIGVFVVYGVCIFCIIMRRIPEYNSWLKEHYSYRENLYLYWLYIVLFTFLVLMVVYAVTTVYDTALGDLIYISGSVLGWAWICYCIRRQVSVIDELEVADSPGDVEMSNDLELRDMPVFESAIKEHFISKELYLNPTLKLSEMAKAIGTNRTYLSRYLNETLQTSFYDYVNSLRLAHACELIETTDYTIMSIASLSGFNSYSTFRRAFIAKYNITPQEYRNKTINK